MKLKRLLREVGVELIAAAVVAILVTVGGYIWARYQGDPQPVLVGLLIALVLFNFLTLLFFYYKWRESREEMHRSIQGLDDSIQEQRRAVAGVQELLNQSSLFAMGSSKSREGRRFDDFFPITKREFNEGARTLRLEFTNQGDRTFYVKQVRYSDSGLPRAEIKYRRRSGTDKFRRPILDFDKTKSEVLPDEVFPLEIQLKRPWTSSELGAVGTLAHLYIDVEYGDAEAELYYSI